MSYQCNRQCPLHAKPVVPLCYIRHCLINAKMASCWSLVTGMEVLVLGALDDTNLPMLGVRKAQCSTDLEEFHCFFPEVAFLVFRYYCHCSESL